MIRDEDLMRLVCRTAALTRRTPNGERRRGYGHILSTLMSLDEGQGVSQQTLADSVGIRAQSLSEAIASLEESGYVERRVGDSDRRRMLVFITEAGAERSHELAAERAERAHKVFGAMSEDEKSALFTLLTRLTEQSAEE